MNLFDPVLFLLSFIRLWFFRCSKVSCKSHSTCYLTLNFTSFAFYSTLHTGKFFSSSLVTWVEKIEFFFLLNSKVQYSKYERSYNEFSRTPDSCALEVDRQLQAAGLLCLDKFFSKLRFSGRPGS